MSVQIRRSTSGQAMPRETVQLPAEAFGPSDKTTVYWLGNAGFLLNSRGTTIMCDPLLVGFDMPTLVEPPILPQDVPSFDALLYTHIDNDHFARETLAGIKDQAGEVHASHYVAQVARDEEHVTGERGRYPHPHLAQLARAYDQREVSAPHVGAQGVLRLLVRYARRLNLAAQRLSSAARVP